MFYNTDDLTDGEIELRLLKTAEADEGRAWLPAYYFSVCLSDGTPVGSCELRVGHNESAYYGGNIGYEIFPGYRGHRFAAKACRLLFRLAEKHRLTYVLINCAPGNLASQRTCEALGGRLETVADLPEYNDMYRLGERRICIFRFPLPSR